MRLNTINLINFIKLQKSIKLIILNKINHINFITVTKSIKLIRLNKTNLINLISYEINKINKIK